jgi:hypothetical protein
MASQVMINASMALKHIINHGYGSIEAKLIGMDTK